MPMKECGCCGRNLPASQVRYRHSFRDGRPDMDYCLDCYNIGCDLDTCDWITRQHSPIGDYVQDAIEEARKLKGEPTTVCPVCRQYTHVDEFDQFVTHDSDPLLRVLCEGSGAFAPDYEAPTTEELAEVYRSLGAEPPAEEG